MADEPLIVVHIHTS